MFSLIEIEAELTEAEEYYSSLLLNQYLKIKAIATMKTLTREAFADYLIKQVNEAFDIETATGVQLDVLGEYIGLSRVVPYQIPRPYYNYDDFEIPNVSAIGFIDYEDSTQNDESVFYIYQFDSIDTQTLSDDEYRILLKLKILLNYSDLTTQSIHDLLLLFFGTNVTYFDNQNMTITYFITPASKRVVDLAYNTNLLPKPMGVRIGQIFAIPNPSGIFTYANYEVITQPAEGYNDYNEPLNGLTMINYVDAL